METIELYCFHKIVLGWQVRIRLKKKIIRVDFCLIRAETEKGLSRKHIIEGLRASLDRLQLQYVDIVFANKPDSSVPMEGKTRREKY